MGMTIGDFVRGNGLDLLLHYSEGKWTARIEDAERKDGIVLTSEFGLGATLKEAVLQYAGYIAGGLLVFDATDPELRKELPVPALSKTETGLAELASNGLGLSEPVVGRLLNWKFESAKFQATPADRIVAGGALETLAATFGNPGWFDGSMGELVGAMVALLIGPQETEGG
jgi:hypothetical protein